MFYRSRDGEIFNLDRTLRVYFTIDCRNDVLVYSGLEEKPPIMEIIDLELKRTGEDSRDCEMALAEGRAFTSWLFDKLAAGAPAGSWEEYEKYRGVVSK